MFVDSSIQNLTKIKKQNEFIEQKYWNRSRLSGFGHLQMLCLCLCVKSPKFRNHTIFVHSHQMRLLCIRMLSLLRCWETNSVWAIICIHTSIHTWKKVKWNKKNCDWLMIFFLFVVVTHFVCVHNIQYRHCILFTNSMYRHHSFTFHFLFNSVKSKNHIQNINVTKYILYFESSKLTQISSFDFKLYKWKCEFNVKWQSIYWWMVFALWNLHFR